MIKAIIEILALYLLYKLIFDFIIPITQTTKQVKRQFNDMQQKMNEFKQNANYQQNTTSSNKPNTKPNQEEYIDFEEVK